ncbi:hypothetical protein FS749_012134 [Ceratobasidium sp. UAMH 11750]|nr:hypothetical protein FS749_012134 [Ceratobasidium sp. UAMH 11750]
MRIEEQHSTLCTHALSCEAIEPGDARKGDINNPALTGDELRDGSEGGQEDIGIEHENSHPGASHGVERAETHLEYLDLLILVHIVLIVFGFHFLGLHLINVYIPSAPRAHFFLSRSSSSSLSPRSHLSIFSLNAPSTSRAFDLLVTSSCHFIPSTCLLRAVLGVISILDYAVTHSCSVQNAALAAPSSGAPETMLIRPAYPLGARTHQSSGSSPAEYMTNRPLAPAQTSAPAAHRLTMYPESAASCA